MAHLNFEATPAYAVRCPVCGERYVGGAPDVDVNTETWIGNHTKWHETSSIPPLAGMLR